MKVARCTKIISPNTDDANYVTTLKQIAKVWQVHIYLQSRIFWRLNPNGSFFNFGICSLWLDWETKCHQQILRKACELGMSLDLFLVFY